MWTYFSEKLDLKLNAALLNAIRMNIIQQNNIPKNTINVDVVLQNVVAPTGHFLARDHIKKNFIFFVIYKQAQ